MCYEAATRLVFIEKTRLNLLTSHLLVKVGFLDSNLLRTFGGSNEVRFGWSWTRFKATDVSYNFPRNSLLQKIHIFFVISKIPLEGHNYQKWTSKNDLFSYFHFKLLQSYPEIIKISEFDLSCLKFIKDTRDAIFHFWCGMTILPLVSFLLVFAQFLSFVRI